MGFKALQPVDHLFGDSLLNCFELKEDLKPSSRLWIVLPGLLGDSSIMQGIIPKNESALLLNYKSNESLHFNDYITELTNIICNYKNTYKVSLIGYSMGGRLAFSVMPTISIHIESLHLISSGLPLQTDAEKKQKKQFDAMAIKKCNSLTPLEFSTWWYQLDIYRGFNEHPEFKSYVNQLAKKIDLKKISILLKTLSSTQMKNELFNVSTPTTFIYGEKDSKYQNIAQKHNKFFNNLTISDIPNTAHLCWFEAPEAVKNILTQTN